MVQTNRSVCLTGRECQGVHSSLRGGFGWGIYSDVCYEASDARGSVCCAGGSELAAFVKAIVMI